MIIHYQYICIYIYLYIQVWFQTSPCFFTLECQVWVIYVPENKIIFCPSNAVWFRLTSLSFFVKKSQISGVVSIRQLSWQGNLPPPQHIPPNKDRVFFAGLKGKQKPSLKLTGLPLKIWVFPKETIIFQPSIFRGKLLVSGRVGFQLPKAGRSPSEGRVTYGGGWNWNRWVDGF